MPASALTAAFSMAAQKQRIITGDTTLTPGDASATLLVDSSLNPVTITVLPRADILPGRYFNILALSGSTNPVTIVFAPGDSYNDGATAPLVLDEDGSSLSLYSRAAGGWYVPLIFPVTNAQKSLLIQAASADDFYQDDPGAQGTGTYAESFAVRTLGLAPIVRIVQASVRIDFPAAPGETAQIRFFRYRKTGPFGAFSVSNASSITVIDDTTPWSWTLDITGTMNGLDFDPITDSLAISNVYTAGGAPTMRALRVDFEFGLP